MTSNNLYVSLITYSWACGAAVAQGTHNPLVVGSNPTGPIFLCFDCRCFINKKLFVVLIWVLLFLLFDSVVCRQLLDLGYPRDFDIPKSYRYPAPYVLFVHKNVMKETSFDKNNYFKGAEKNTIKVAFFGGSTGVPISSEKFSKVLTKKLKRDVIVENFSCYSANHRQHLHLMLEVLPKYNPDIIIFYGGFNETILNGWFDPRPGYPYSYFYRGELSTIKKFLIEYSALIGAIEFKQQRLTGLRKLQDEYKPFSEEWNEEIKNKYFETMKLANNVSKTFTSDNFNEPKFYGFYQPYQAKLFPEFYNTHLKIRNQIKTVDYIYDLHDEYNDLGPSIWEDNCHVSDTSGANERIIDVMSDIIINDIMVNKF